MSYSYDDDINNSTLTIGAAGSTTAGASPWLINSNALSSGTLITGGAGSSLTWQDYTTTAHSAMTVKGILKVDGDIEIDGRSLSDRLSAIEDRLEILRPNPEIEKEWDELRELGERYRELEADILSKQRLIAALIK